MYYINVYIIIYINYTWTLQSKERTSLTFYISLPYVHLPDLTHAICKS